MESGEITLSRARHRITYPARFQLVAAMNPCPCGYLGDPERACRCTPDQIQRYRARISGPLLDRIDLHVQVQRLPPGDCCTQVTGESSAAVQARVLALPSATGAAPGLRQRPTDAAQLSRALPAGNLQRKQLEAPQPGCTCPAEACTGRCGWHAPSPTWMTAQGLSRSLAYC